MNSSDYDLGSWKLSQSQSSATELCSQSQSSGPYHLKFSFQLKPPHVISLAGMYSKVSSLITSMMGQTTVVLSSAILDSKGSSQPSVHSQWASRNVITCPVTCFAPRSLALIRPDLFSVRYTYVGTGNVFT